MEIRSWLSHSYSLVVILVPNFFFPGVMQAALSQRKSGTGTAAKLQDEAETVAVQTAAMRV